MALARLLNAPGNAGMLSTPAIWLAVVHKALWRWLSRRIAIAAAVVGIALGLT
ncbi:MAG: hypothetical protein AAF215_21920 [Cyanobacteria bacterium P01_A01_bin.123]